MKQIFKKIIVSIIQYQAELVLKKYTPKVVVVVGSVGKTTTKDAIYRALSVKYHTRKSEKSFNSEVGLPLTILGCHNGWANPLLWIKNIIEGCIVIVLKNKYPEWLVLEVGADRPGDITSVAEWLKADVVVLTRLPDVPVHVEAFETPAALIKEKLSIIKALKDDGTLVINGDDKILHTVKEAHSDKNVVSFGIEKTNDVHSLRYAIASKNKTPTGIRFHVRNGDNEESVELNNLLGKQHLYPVLAAFAVGHVLEIDNGSIAESFKEYAGPNGRMNIVSGIKNTTIIDDTYNSSPIAVEEALNVLEAITTDGRKIIVLGDMLELGRYSIDEHKRLGKKAAGIADIIITVGFRARGFAEGALQMGMHGSKIFQYDDVHRAGKELDVMLKEKDIILIKASQSIRLEKIVEEIMAEPNRKTELLVRQDYEWSRR